jgi:hypothetical protein
LDPKQDDQNEKWLSDSLGKWQEGCYQYTGQRQALDRDFPHFGKFLLLHEFITYHEYPLGQAELHQVIDNKDP